MDVCEPNRKPVLGELLRHLIPLSTRTTCRRTPLMYAHTRSRTHTHTHTHWKYRHACITHTLACPHTLCLLGSKPTPSPSCGWAVLGRPAPQQYSHTPSSAFYYCSTARAKGTAAGCASVWVSVFHCTNTHRSRQIVAQCSTTERRWTSEV